MNGDLTSGNITAKLLRFAFPLMVGNVLQQLYAPWKSGVAKGRPRGYNREWTLN